MSTGGELLERFERWWKSSKYCQVVYSPNSRQPALDGYQAAHAEAQAEIEALRKDAERYRWIRTESARSKGQDDPGALTISVTYVARRADGTGFTGLAVTPLGHDFDVAIDAAMASGVSSNGQ